MKAPWWLFPVLFVLLLAGVWLGQDILRRIYSKPVAQPVLVAIKPGVVPFTNTPPGGAPTGFAQLEFPVVSNKTYTVQLTTDFVEYRNVWTFTAPPGQEKLVWTVNPATGPWPRLLEQQP